MTASCSHLPAARGSHMKDAEGIFQVFLMEIYAGAAGLPGGACAMAAFTAHKMVRAAAAAATGWRDLSHLR